MHNKCVINTGIKVWRA